MKSGGVFTYKVGGRIISFVKSSDIVNVMKIGYGDVGFVGLDKVREKQLGNEWLDIDVEQVVDTQCSIVLAASERQILNDGYHINLLATSYPNTSAEWFRQIARPCPKFLIVTGSVEAYANPQASFVDAIVDVRESGNTLKANDLPNYRIISEPIYTLAVRLANR